MSTRALANNRLPQITAAKLRAVCQRRRSLLVLRAFAIAGMIFLAMLLIASLVDVGWNISHGFRLMLSGLVYSAACLAALIALVPCLRPWGYPEAANLIEQFVPGLRNQALAAVDLAVASDDPKYGSQVFRDQLQSNVAQQIDGLDISAVLSWQRLKKVGIGLAAVATIVLLLSAIPQLQLPPHLLRMLFPTANIARPGQATIHILVPEFPTKNHPAKVPLDEHLLIRAAVEFKNEKDLRPPRYVEIETRGPGESSTVVSVPMTEEKAATKESSIFTYTAMVHVNAPAMQFRVMSDVGESVWHNLLAFPRPKVNQYWIQIESPPYAQVPVKNIESVTADVECVEGGTVQWRFRSDQELAKATMCALDGETDPSELETSEFMVDEDGFWELSLAPLKSRRFRIDLVSEQGIPSSFPATYRLTVRKDQAPRLTWIEPKQSSRVIRPKSAAKMAIAFEDEFPLQSIEQWIRVNRGPWFQRRLSQPETTQAEVRWIWELATYNLQLGDLIDTKVVALDRKGQTGESPEIQWVLAGTELDPRREMETLAREQIADAVSRLAVLARNEESRLKPIRSGWQQEPQNMAKEREFRDAMHVTNQAMIDEAAAVSQSILERFRAIDNLVSREELVGVMDTVAEIQTEATVLQANAPQIDPIDQSQQRLLQAAQRLHDAYRRMVAHDVLADLERDLLDGWRYHQELLRDRQGIGDEIWNRELQLLADHLRILSQEMITQGGYLPEGPARALSDWSGSMEQMVERFENLIAQNPPQSEDERKGRLDAAEKLGNDLLARTRLHQIYSGLPNELLAARREIMQIAGRPNEIVDRAVRDWQTNRSLQADGASLSPTFAPRIAQLARRRLTRLERGDFAAVFGADLGLAERAIEHQLEKHAGDSKQIEEVLQIVSSCVAILETEDRLRSAQQWLEQMQGEERYAASGNRGITENPRLWDSWGLEIERIQDYVRRAAIGNQAADALNGLRWSPAAQAVTQKMGPRRWEQKAAVSASSELETIQHEVQRQAESLAPKFEQARDRLRQLAPTIPELATAAAKLARKDQQQTAKLLEEVQRGEVPHVADRLVQNEQVAAEQEARLSQQLHDALIDLAASQSLMKQEELATAREADTARQLQQKAEQQTAAALQQALSAPANQAPESLAQLSQSQEEKASTFEAIAAHFGEDPLSSPLENSLENQRQRSSSRDDSPLEESARTAANVADAGEKIESSIADAYREAERLARLAEANPRDLLRRLEQELQGNEEMQEALSDLARGLAEQTQRSLEQASRRERDLRGSLHQSDPVGEPRRQEFAHELNAAIEQTSRLAQRLAQETQSQAGLGTQEAEKNELQRIAAALAQSVDEVRQQASSQFPEDLKQGAQQLQQTLQGLQPKLQDVSQKLAQGKQQTQFPEAGPLQQARSSAEQTQTQLQQQDQRAADQQVQMRDQRKQAAERNLQQAQQQLEQAERQREQAREQLSKNPENESSRRALAQAESQVQEKQTLKGLAEELKGRAEQRLAEAQQQRSALDRPPGNLQAPRPNSELAERLTQQVVERSQQLGENVNQMLAASAWIDQIQASRSQLAASASQQTTLQEGVADAARDLDRAAAHQERLGARQSAERLAEFAQRVEATAQNETRNAGEQLTAPGKTAAGAPESRFVSPDETRTISSALQASEKALSQRASELGTMLAADLEPPAGSTRAPGGETPESQENRGGLEDRSSSPHDDPDGAASESLLSPRELAELLDQLDRQLREPRGKIAADPLAPAWKQDEMDAVASLQAARRRAAQQLQQMRASRPSPSELRAVAMRDDSLGASQRSGDVVPQAQGSGAGKVFTTEELAGEPLGAWSRLREKKSDEVVESQREAVSPRYRRQIESYFESLSRRSISK